MIEFTKMHGNGNDFLVIDEYEETIIEEKNKPNFAKNYCDRRFGVGGDGVLFLQQSKKADCRMEIFNSDGTEADMCGNGIRCLARYAKEKRVFEGNEVEIETNSGVLSIETKEREEFWAKVNMGEPSFDKEDIPAKGEEKFLEEEIGDYKVSAANTGVPHAVIFVEDVKEIDLEVEALKIRHHESFKDGANVNFVEVIDEETIRVRTFERGVEGETLSCGTGSVASASVSRKLNKTPADEIKVITNGGDLVIYFEDGEAYMEGPAKTVFHGRILQ